MLLPLLRSALPLSLVASLMIAEPAFAQAPPPPPGAPPPPLGAGSPPPPPPAGGPSVILGHSPGGLRVDVHCTPAESTRACIDLADQLYAKLKGGLSAK